MWRWKFRIPARPLLALPWLGRAPHYCFHMISTDTVVCVGMVGWRVSHLQIGMKVFPSHWVLDNHLKGRRGIILQWDKGKNLGSHLGFVDGSGSRILDIWQQQGSYFLSCLVLLGFPFSQLFGQREQAFHGVLSVPICVLRFPVFLVHIFQQYLGYIRQSSPRNLSPGHSSCCKVLNQFTFFLLFKVFLCLFYIYNAHRFQLQLEEWGKVYPLDFVLEMEVQKRFLKK